jgi:hypothetical protein
MHTIEKLKRILGCILEVNDEPRLVDGILNRPGFVGG